MGPHRPFHDILHALFGGVGCWGKGWGLQSAHMVHSAKWAALAWAGGFCVRGESVTQNGPLRTLFRVMTLLVGLTKTCDVTGSLWEKERNFLFPRVH